MEMNENDEVLSAATKLGEARAKAYDESATKAAIKVFEAESDARTRAVADECDNTIKLNEEATQGLDETLEKSRKTLKEGKEAIQNVYARFPNLKPPVRTPEMDAEIDEKIKQMSTLDDAKKEKIRETSLDNYKTAKAKYLLENGIDNRFDDLPLLERYKNLILQNMEPIPANSLEQEERDLALAMQNFVNVRMQRFDEAIQKQRAERDAARERLHEAMDRYERKHRNDNNFGNFIFTVCKIAALGAVAWFAPPLLGAVGTGLAMGATDAAIQGVGIELGVQDHFSAAEVLESTVGGGVGAGTTGLNVVEHTAVVAASTAVTEVAEVKLGLRDKFDISEVGLQAAASVIAYGMHEIMPNLDKTFGEGSSIASTATKTAVHSVVNYVLTGQPINIQNMAANIAGTVMGDKLGSKVSESIQKPQSPVIEEVPDPNSKTRAKLNLDNMCLVDDPLEDQFKDKHPKMTSVQPSSSLDMGQVIRNSKTNQKANYTLIDNPTLPENISNDLNNPTVNRNVSSKTTNDKVQTTTASEEQNAAKILQKLAEESTRTHLKLNPKIYDQTQRTLEALGDISGSFKSVGTIGIIHGCIELLAETRKHLQAFIYGTPEEHQEAIHDIAADAVLLFGGGAAASKGTKMLSSALDFTLFGRKAGAKVATNAISDSIELFRAVRPEELNQILNTSTFQNIPGMAEGKYFSTTLEGAKQYAEMAEKVFGDPPYTIVRTSVPKSVITDVMKADVDRGIDTLVIPPANLKELTVPQVLEHESLIKKAFG